MLLFMVVAAGLVAASATVTAATAVLRQATCHGPTTSLATNKSGAVEMHVLYFRREHKQIRQTAAVRDWLLPKIDLFCF